MGILTEDMKRVVHEQRLGFVATVGADGTPNLSPKGTTTVWDDDHLVFAHICSPATVANLSANPHVEINVVDPILRKGYRFKGTAVVVTGGPRFDEIVAFYRDHLRGDPALIARIEAAVLVRVTRAAPLVSPAYDTGTSEAEIGARWVRHHLGLAEGRDRPVK